MEKECAPAGCNSRLGSLSGFRGNGGKDKRVRQAKASRRRGRTRRGFSGEGRIPHGCYSASVPWKTLVEGICCQEH